MQAGLPTVFVRLTGCPLRCVYCDSEYAFYGGQWIHFDDILAEIRKYETPYVCVTGGEPLAQPEFLVALLDRCGELDIHRAVDTCGRAPRDVLLNVATRADLFLFDLKLADGACHVQHTGVDCDVIQDNLKALCDTGVAIEIRIPVVPGISGDGENLDALGAFVQSLPRALPVRLLAYHRAAMDKYTRFGLAPPLPDMPEPTLEEMETLERRLGISSAGTGQ